MVLIGFVVGWFGNFINGELWGCVIDLMVLWVMLFLGVMCDDVVWLLKYLVFVEKWYFVDVFM